MRSPIIVSRSANNTSYLKHATTTLRPGTCALTMAPIDQPNHKCISTQSAEARFSPYSRSLHWEARHEALGGRCPYCEGLMGHPTVLRAIEAWYSVGCSSLIRRADRSASSRPLRGLQKPLEYQPMCLIQQLRCLNEC